MERKVIFIVIAISLGIALFFGYVPPGRVTMPQFTDGWWRVLVFVILLAILYQMIEINEKLKSK